MASYTQTGMTSGPMDDEQSASHMMEEEEAAAPEANTEWYLDQRVRPHTLGSFGGHTRGSFGGHPLRHTWWLWVERVFGDRVCLTVIQYHVWCRRIRLAWVVWRIRRALTAHGDRQS